MSIKSVIESDIAAARRGEMGGTHFGIVCSSWTVLNRFLNGGTRMREKPAGNGTLHREIVGNKQANFMFLLIDVLRESRILYNVGNPESSAFWWLEQWDKVPYACV